MSTHTINNGSDFVRKYKINVQCSFLVTKKQTVKDFRSGSTTVVAEGSHEGVSVFGFLCLGFCVNFLYGIFCVLIFCMEFSVC